MGYIKNFKIVETKKLGLCCKTFASRLETSINGVEVRQTKNNGYKKLEGVRKREVCCGDGGRGVGGVKQLIGTSNTSHQFVDQNYSTVALNVYLLFLDLIF